MKHGIFFDSQKYMVKQIYILIFFFYNANISFAQHFHVLPAALIGNDTIPVVYLNEVRIVDSRIWKSAKAEQRYNKLAKDVKKVYPYARMASVRLNSINTELVQITDKSLRKEFIKKAENDLKIEFEDKLKALTIKQGKILIKLIDRECNSTTYAIVKELKGTASVFFWQTLARLFGSNLKWEYDPEKERDIELIIQSIQDGELAINNVGQ